MSTQVPVEISVPPLLGRAGYFAQRKIFQVFASIRDTAGNFLTPDFNLFPEGWMSDYLPQMPGECGDGQAPRAHKCERLWRVGTGCLVAYRNSVPQLNPLTVSEFEALSNPGAAIAVGSETGGNGYFRIRYLVSSAQGAYSFDLDIGETVEIYALQVNTTLIGPPNTLLITQENDSKSATPAERNGLVIDARLGSRIMPIEASTGMREGRLTQIIPVPINTQVEVTVPKFARSFHIYQDGAGAASGAWTKFVGPPAAGCDVGSITFTGRSSRADDEALGRESVLQTDDNAVNARLFQVQWTIRP